MVTGQAPVSGLEWKNTPGKKKENKPKVVQVLFVYQLKQAVHQPKIKIKVFVKSEVSACTYQAHTAGTYVSRIATETEYTAPHPGNIISLCTNPRRKNCTKQKEEKRDIEKEAQQNTHVTSGVDFFFFSSSYVRRMGKNKPLAHYTSTCFQTCRVNLTRLYSQSSASWRILQFSW